MSLFDTIWNLEEYEELIKKGCATFGAKVFLNQTDMYGRTALFYADLEFSKLLISAGIDINHVDNDGENALFSAIHSNKAKLLIEHGIDINHIDNEGRTVLFYVNGELVKLLISAGIDVDCVDKGGIKVIDMIYDKDVKELIQNAPIKSSSKSANKR